MRVGMGTNPLRWASAAVLWAGAVLPMSVLVSPVLASSPIRFAGQISGLVADSDGRPQSGAMVALYNKQDHFLQRVATDFSGNFSFDDLVPDLYNVRVNLSNFVPAMRDRVPVRIGMRSLLDVNLSRMFSSIHMVATVPAPGGLMSDNWKWTLRADSSMRPILRFLPSPAGSEKPAAEPTEKAAVFNDSRGLVRISASDGSQSGTSGEADLGTQFAFATSLYGSNNLQLSGNVGYAGTSGSPAASFRTSYSRAFGTATPKVAVTMRQLYIAGRDGQSGEGVASPLPPLRTLAVSLSDKAEIGDSLTLEYGTGIDMVSFIDHLHYFSPYAKLTYELDHGSVDLTYTSGNARPELGLSSTDPNSDLQRELAAVSLMPRVTLSGGRAKVQRGDDYEVGVTQRFGSREYRVSAYGESVANSTLTIANPDLSSFTGDLLPDMFSSSALFNAGRFTSMGYTAQVIQNVGDNYKIAAAVGSIGVMSVDTSMPVRSAEDLRRGIGTANRPAVTLRASGTVKQAGTRFMAEYQWADYRSAMPGPQFSTQSARPAPGFNIMLRQPIPFPGVPWHLEASAELRNLLAQGYLPLTLTGGHQLLLVNTPRSVRGGLAFVF